MSRYQCWNCLTHHNGDYERCDNCISKGHDKPTNWRPGPNYVPPTNADRLRAMSNEELAVFLESSRGCPTDEDCEYGVHATPENCIKHWDIWLQQPAKEDT